MTHHVELHENRRNYFHLYGFTEVGLERETWSNYVKETA